MKKIKVLALCAIVTSFAMSCSDDRDEPLNESQTDILSGPVSKEHKTAIENLGLGSNEVKYVTNEYPDGTLKSGVLTADDIFVTLDALAQTELASDADGKQYRTRALVSQNRTINVVGYTGGRFALTSRMRTGLQRAVDNYNAINISLRFNLRFAATTNADMVVYNAGSSDAGGQAEFPSGGRPGKFIQIFGGMDRFNSDVNEHVAAHEMGHALGFRHTDYARRRCDNINEGQSSFGAIAIPGTPSGNQWGGSNIDSNSIMISCFDSGEDGEFSNFDIVALEFLY